MIVVHKSKPDCLTLRAFRILKTGSAAGNDLEYSQCCRKVPGAEGGP